MNIKTNADELRGQLAPLYKQYPGQTNPQPALLYIRPDHYRVSAEYNPEVGNGCPMRVWNGLDVTVGLSNTVKGDALADWLESEHVQALLERVCAGHSERWDGNNYKGHLDEDAQDALEELEREAIEGWSESDCAQVWKSADWVDPCTYWAKDRLSVYVEPYTITRKTTDEELEAWAQKFESIAEADGIYLCESMLKHFEYLRDQCEEEEED